MISQDQFCDHDGRCPYCHGMNCMSACMEADYQRWCADRGIDPEDGGAVVAALVA